MHVAYDTKAADDEVRRDFRRTAATFATGVCVVTAEHNGRPAGMTVNSFTSVSLEPLLVLVSLARDSRTLRAVASAGCFGISVLRRDQRSVARAFATRGAFPFDLVDRVDGFLVVPGALASFSCEVDAIVSAGDHDLVVGRVESFAAAVGEPLVFHRGAFGTFSCDALAGFPMLHDDVGW